MKAKIFAVLTVSATLLLSGAVYGALKDNTLTIRHISEVPGGKERVICVETISNINDIYYYAAAQSPVASKLLKSGYSLKDEKNRVIEADVVTNGGQLDLKYTPAAQEITVTYYKKDENGETVSMGEIKDSAYVGEIYTPMLPINEGATVGDKYAEEGRIVRLGENHFAVTYEDSEIEAASSTAVIARNMPVSGRGVLLKSSSKNEGYAYGYEDGAFRPDQNITKRELFTLFYSVWGQTPNWYDSDKITAFLIAEGIIGSPEMAKLADAVTRQEFYGYMNRLNEKLNGIVNRYQGNEWLVGEKVSRAEAVAAINSIVGIDAEKALLRAGFTDVYEDHWAYGEVLKASRN